MSQIFKQEHVGHQVSDPRFGNGVITGFNTYSDYPVTVTFDGNSIANYLSDGRYSKIQLPILQFGPLDNWERRTQPQVQDGQIIEIFRSGSWQLAKVAIIDGQRMFYCHTTYDGAHIYGSLTNHTWRCVL